MQRCVVPFKRNVLAHVPQLERKVIPKDLKEVFSMKCWGTAESLARAFIERYRDRFKQVVEVFVQGLDETLTYLDFPSSHQRYIKSTNVLEQLFWGGEMEDQGDGGVPERKEPGQPGHGGAAQGECSSAKRIAFRTGRSGDTWTWAAVGRGKRTHKNRDLTVTTAITRVSWRPPSVRLSLRCSEIAKTYVLPAFFPAALGVIQTCRTSCWPPTPARFRQAARAHRGLSVAIDRCLVALLVRKKVSGQGLGLFGKMVSLPVLKGV